MTFNAAAVNLIEDIEQYPWVVVRVGTIENKPVMLGFQFIKEPIPGSLPVNMKSKRHKGATLASRELVKSHFNYSGIGMLFLRLDVEKEDDTTLVIHLITEEKLKKEIGLDKLEQAITHLDDLF